MAGALAWRSLDSEQPTSGASRPAATGMSLARGQGFDDPYSAGLEAFEDQQWLRAIQHFRRAAGSAEPDDTDLIDQALRHLAQSSPSDLEQAGELFPERAVPVASQLAQMSAERVEQAVHPMARTLGSWRRPRLRKAFAVGPTFEQLADALRHNAEIGTCDDGATPSVTVELMVSWRVEHVSVLTESVDERVRDCLVAALLETSYREAPSVRSYDARLTTAGGEEIRVPSGTTPLRVVLW